MPKYLNRSILESMDKIFSKVTGFQVDSRKIERGNAFFALEGKRVQGINFLQQVAKNKGVVAFVPRGYRGESFGLKLIFVDNVLNELKNLAKKSLNGEKIVGITGSLGKTTTKEFTYQLLKGSFKVDKSPGNQNSQVGLPLSLLNRDRGAKVLVLEYGIDKLGDMEGLLEVVRPDIGVLTKVAEVHVEGLGRIENIAREKKKLLYGAKEKVFPKEWGNGLEGLSFGEGGDVWIEYENDRVYIVDGKRFEIDPPFRESHFLENILPSYLVGKSLGVSRELLFERMRELKTPSMRFEKVVKEGVLIIKDMYNASLLSMKKALGQIPQPKNGGKIIAVLGDMADMGVEAERMHFEVGEFASDKVDFLILLGENAQMMKKGFAKSNKPCFHFKEKEPLCTQLKNLVKKDDVVLIKGSRFLQLETIYEKVFETK